MEKTKLSFPTSPQKTNMEDEQKFSNLSKQKGFETHKLMDYFVWRDIPKTEI